MVTILAFLFVTIPAFLFVFSLVVVIHELGHFSAARLFGIRVDRFSLGFGKSLLSVRDRHGTEWTLATIPLGGYVKFFGDASAASNPDVDRLAQIRAEIEEKDGPEAVNSCYHFKPVWQRAIVAAAGPFANFVLALVIFISAAAIAGDRGYRPIVGFVEPGSPAEAAGFQKGDLVTAIDGKPIRYYHDIQQFAALAAGDPAVLTVDRDGVLVDVDVTVGRRVTTDSFGGESEIGFIGLGLGLPAMLASPVPGSPAETAGFEAGDQIVAINGEPVDYLIEVMDRLDEAAPGVAEVAVLRGGGRVEIPVELTAPLPEGESAIGPLGLRADASSAAIVERFGLFGAVSNGAAKAWQNGVAPARYIGRIFTGKESGRELGGILRIGKVAGSLAQQAYLAGSEGGPLAGLLSAVSQLVLLAGALSVAIGLLNLLPIPILDGGHLLYYAYEAVAGRPLGEGAQEWGFRIGLALVFGLMIFATWNDLRYLRVFEAIGNVFS